MNWNELVAMQPETNPFLSFAFLHALHESGCASDRTGWEPRFLTLWNGDQLEAALPLYLKFHSYGEYVFDWAWADAYHRHGLEYYPKLLSSIPFTPVAGPRLMVRNQRAKEALINAFVTLQQSTAISSSHVLFPTAHEASLLKNAGFAVRSGVQFHWENQPYASFEEFLSSLEHKKRKNIRAERRKVQQAGITFRRVPGTAARESDWHFFKRCYDHTYAAHYSTPYLSLDFFLDIAASMPQQLLLVIAECAGRPIAASLSIHSESVLYGRYWGALEHHSCLHFETAYYQPLEFCIESGISRFEGGAQGEHKMARGFLPQRTYSAHWLAHPAFFDAIKQYVTKENNGVEAYVDELADNLPFRSVSKL